MVLIVPMYEEDAETTGIYYNTAAVIDADGTYLGKYRKTHIPHVKGFWEKFYFRPGNMGYPVFDTAVGKVGVYICYDRHFPEGARALGLNGAELVFIPSATSRGLSRVPVARRAGLARARQRLLRRDDQPGRDRAAGRGRLLRAVLLRRSARPVRRRRRRRPQGGAAGPRPRHGHDHRGPAALAVLPRPTPGCLRRPGPSLAAGCAGTTMRSATSTDDRSRAPESALKCISAPRHDGSAAISKTGRSVPMHYAHVVPSAS